MIPISWDHEDRCFQTQRHGFINYGSSIYWLLFSYYSVDICVMLIGSVLPSMVHIGIFVVPILCIYLYWLVFSEILYCFDNCWWVCVDAMFVFAFLLVDSFFCSELLFFLPWPKTVNDTISNSGTHLSTCLVSWIPFVYTQM